MKHRILTLEQIELLRGILLGRCQKLIGEMSEYSSAHSQQGRSPRVWRVVECDSKNDWGMVGGTEVSIWLVTEDCVSEAPHGSIRTPGDRDGMYHFQAHGAFYIHPTELLCWFDYQVGPRYGLGCRIELATSIDGAVYISSERDTWRS
jgi:hypothetical protein